MVPRVGVCVCARKLSLSNLSVPDLQGLGLFWVIGFSPQRAWMHAESLKEGLQEHFSISRAKESRHETYISQALSEGLRGFRL